MTSFNVPEAVVEDINEDEQRPTCKDIEDKSVNVYVRLTEKYTQNRFFYCLLCKDGTKQSDYCVMTVSHKKIIKAHLFLTYHRECIFKSDKFNIRYNDFARKLYVDCIECGSPLNDVHQIYINDLFDVDPGNIPVQAVNNFNVILQSPNKYVDRNELSIFYRYLLQVVDYEGYIKYKQSQREEFNRRYEHLKQGEQLLIPKINAIDTVNAGVKFFTGRTLRDHQTASSIRSNRSSDVFPNVQQHRDGIISFTVNGIVVTLDTAANGGVMAITL